MYLGFICSVYLLYCKPQCLNCHNIERGIEYSPHSATILEPRGICRCVPICVLKKSQKGWTVNHPPAFCLRVMCGYLVNPVFLSIIAANGNWMLLTANKNLIFRWLIMKWRIVMYELQFLWKITSYHIRMINNASNDSIILGSITIPSWIISI